MLENLVAQLYAGQEELAVSAWRNDTPEFLKNMQGSYFKYRKFKHQPCWCSYNLHDLLPALRETGGIITDENDNILYQNLSF